MPHMGGRTASSIWLLSGQVADGESVRHIPVHTSPFRVGRRSDLALSLNCRTVSGVHAEIIDQGETLLLRNLQSTNGTYVNGQRIRGSCTIQSDDLIQFADVPFRARRQQALNSGLTIHEDLCDHALALVQFDQLMSSRAVAPYYQPIVNLDTRETLGYEVLGRSVVVGLEMPDAMFRGHSTRSRSRPQPHVPLGGCPFDIGAGSAAAPICQHAPNGADSTWID